MRASDIDDQSENILVKNDTVPDTIVKTDTAPTSTWDLQDAKCILSMKSDCCIDVKGFRFFTMERLFYALQLLILGDKKFIGQLAKYKRMDYVYCIILHNERYKFLPISIQSFYYSVCCINVLWCISPRFLLILKILRIL